MQYRKMQYIENKTGPQIASILHLTQNLNTNLDIIKTAHHSGPSRPIAKYQNKLYHTQPPAKNPTTKMAGTSGCIPDYEVNFFGQLCKPASCRSTTATSESTPHADTSEAQPPTSTSTAKQAPPPDRIHELFTANQELIRGLSLGSVETYVATLKEVFAEVRRGRCEEAEGNDRAGRGEGVRDEAQGREEVGEREVQGKGGKS